MTLHPSEGRAGNPYGHLKTVEQHHQLATLRDSWGNPGIPKDSEEKAGYADVESNECFPHPHSLDDGGEMRETHYQIGVRGVSRPFLYQK
jgi:hypothetical protein